MSLDKLVSEFNLHSAAIKSLIESDAPLVQIQFEDKKLQECEDKIANFPNDVLQDAISKIRFFIELASDSTHGTMSGSLMKKVTNVLNDLDEGIEI